MESALSQALAPEDIQVIESALINDFLTTSIEGLTQVDAAILISKGRYFYQRRFDEKPPRYRYKCLSPDTLRLAFNNQLVDSGWISPGVVRCGSSMKGSWAVKFIFPTRYCIELSEIGNVTVPLPGLLFLGLEKTYWVCAVADKTFDSDALCYYAPLPNVYTADSHICWGTNTPPIAGNQTITQAWELFIHSPFTRELTTGKSNQHRSDIREQLIDLHRATKKHFPTKTLLPIGSPQIAVKQLVQELLLDD